MQRFKKQVDQIITAYRLRNYPCFIEQDLTFRLLGHLVKSNGKLTEQYVKQLHEEMALLRLNKEAIHKAQQSFLLGQDMVTEQFELSLRQFIGSECAKKAILESCWRFIWLDRHVALREYQLVHLWGYWLGWSRQHVEALGEPYRPIYISSEYKEALDLLGVSTDSTPKQIKKRYKQLLSQCHPDKVLGTGGNAYDVEKATAQTIKLQQAYIVIRMLQAF